MKNWFTPFENLPEPRQSVVILVRLEREGERIPKGMYIAYYEKNALESAECMEGFVLIGREYPYTLGYRTVISYWHPLADVPVDA